MEPDRSCARLTPFPLWLAPGISTANAWTFMLANFTVIGALAFLNVAQSYILTEHLKLAKDIQGTISGDLAFWNEIIIILLASPFGILADRIGRRPIVVAALFSIAAGFVIYAYATTVAELTVGRIVYAVGAAAGSGMVATIGADYPQEVSRGKMIGISSVMNALGIVVLSALLGQLPAFLTKGGMDPVDAGTWMMLITAGVCVAVALILQIGLKGGVPAAQEKTERVSVTELIKVGFSAMRNPRIALSYAAAFTSRGDLVVVGIFISLWSIQAGTAMGLDASEAQKRGVQVFAMSQTMALIWSPVMGWIMDKVNRVTAIAIAMVLAGAGYLATALLKSPIEGAGIAVFTVLAIGQVSALISSQGLIGQESPPKERGAVVGMFTLWGGVGVLFATSVGGRLYDSWAPYAPFVIMGIANILLLIAAIIIRIKAPGLSVRSTPQNG
jgi:MFS family permease